MIGTKAMSTSLDVTCPSIYDRILNANIALIPGKYQLTAKAVSGGGLRLMEWMRLRGKDLDPEMNEMSVATGKGGKERLALLPGTPSLCPATNARAGSVVRELTNAARTPQRSSLLQPSEHGFEIAGFHLAARHGLFHGWQFQDNA